MNIAFVVQLIEQGAVLLPQFIDLWNTVKASFSANDQAAVDAALAAAQAKDKADTAAYDKLP